MAVNLDRRRDPASVPQMSSDTKVLVLIDSLGGGGAERSTIEIARRLRTLGIETKLVALVDVGMSRRAWVDESVEVAVLGTKRAVVAAYRLRRMMKVSRPDVVHTALFASDMVGRLACIGTGVPVISSVVTTPYAAERRSNPALRSWKLSVIKQFERSMSRLTARFHAVSDGVADHVARELRVDRDKFVVAERGRKAERFVELSDAQREELRTEMGLRRGDTCVLAVGRIEYPKAFDTLAKALSHLPHSHRLAIAGVNGSGTAVAALQAAITDSGVTDRVVLLGERADIPALMAAADVLCVSSRYEGTSGVTLEAMAAGLPIVATKAEGLRGILTDDHNAVLADIDNPSSLAAAILRVTSDDEFASRLVANGKREFETRFTADVAATRMAALYRDVAAG